MAEENVSGQGGGQEGGNAAAVDTGNKSGNDAGTGQKTDTGKPTGFTYTEDRSKWIPPHRLGEETTKRTAAEKRIQELESAYQQEQRRVQALAGVSPQDPDAAELEEIRERFKQLRPDLAKLDEKSIDRLLQMAERFDEVEGSVQANWDAHGKRSFKTVTDKVEEAIGGELTQRQRVRLNDALVLTLYNDPQLKQRYDSGDQTLLDEFAKEWVEDWFEPARRKALANEVDRTGRKVPNGRGTGVTTTNKPKVDVNDPEQFKNALAGAFREEGGKFGFRR